MRLRNVLMTRMRGANGASKMCPDRAPCAVRMVHPKCVQIARHECAHGMCSWHLLMECAHEMCSWNVLMNFFSPIPLECAHEFCSWNVLMACAHGMCSWHVLMECAHGCAHEICSWKVLMNYFSPIPLECARDLFSCSALDPGP